jgi:hypothetical protein
MGPVSPDGESRGPHTTSASATTAEPRKAARSRPGRHIHGPIDRRAGRVRQPLMAEEMISERPMITDPITIPSEVF